MSKTTIELDDNEAKLFIKFLQYRDYWEKIFKIRDGSVELHIDSEGVIRKVGYNTFEKVIHNAGYVSS